MMLVLVVERVVSVVLGASLMMMISSAEDLAEREVSEVSADLEALVR